MTTDRLALAHVIEDAGIERGKAERVASAILDAISDNVATKQDIALVRTDIAAVRAEVTRLETAIRAEVAQVETVTRAETARLQGTTKAEIAALEGRLALRFEQTDRRIDQVVIRLGALAVVLLGLLFAALHLWPPHG